MLPIKCHSKTKNYPPNVVQRRHLLCGLLAHGPHAELGVFPQVLAQPENVATENISIK